MNTATISELTEIQHRLAAAWAVGDDSVHRRILADDWKVTDPGGNVLTKDQVINTAFSAERNITTARIDDIEVRDFGDWAIVTGRTHMAGTLADEDIDVTLLFTDVFVRGDGDVEAGGVDGQRPAVAVDDDTPRGIGGQFGELIFRSPDREIGPFRLLQPIDTVDQQAQDEHDHKTHE